MSVGTDARRLAFVYHPFSFATMAVVNAAQGVCDLTWVVDSSVAEVELMAKLLRRLGAVVDVAGLSPQDAAAAVAASRPDGVLALADSQLLWTARLAEMLELPFITPETAQHATDKYSQRCALEAGGVPVPGHWLIPQSTDEPAWSALQEQARFPAMLKPRRGSGSRGIVRIRSVDELRSCLRAMPDALGSPEPVAMLEEYLPDRGIQQDFADYVSVESIVSDGHVSHVAITGRLPPAEPFRETGFFIPSALDGDERQAALDSAGATIAAIGVTIGCLHTEIKLTPEGPRVIELNARIGGSVARMMPLATGIDLLAVAMRLALGEQIVFDEMPRCAAVTYMLYAQAPASMRRIRAIEGVERLRADPAVLELILKRGPGQSVDWRDGNHGHVFSVLGVVADHDQLKALVRRVHAETRIDGE
jgi:biotin carboxylase